MPMTVKNPKLKPGVEFQHGGRLFSATGSSNISAVNCDVWSKFGMQIVFYLSECETSQNRKTEIDLRRYGRHIAATLEFT